jgi:hypothetical protein
MGDNLSPVLQRFRAAAENFIETVDSFSSLEREAFLSSVSHCLAELYSSALYLPAVEPETTGVDETPFPTEQWAGLFRSIKEKRRLVRWTLTGRSLIRRKRRPLHKGAWPETSQRFTTT